MIYLFNRQAKTHPLADEVNMFPQPLLGITDETIGLHLPGRAKFQATYWPAKLYNDSLRVVLNPGELLMVVGIENITLLVMPAEP